MPRERIQCCRSGKESKLESVVIEANRVGGQLLGGDYPECCVPVKKIWNEGVSTI